MQGLKQQDILELEIGSLAYGGKGVAHDKGFTIFVERALPGQKVRVKIKRKKSNFAEAYIVDILAPSSAEVSAPCPHFGACGGCLFQNLDYQEQLHQKTNQVRETLAHIGGFSGLDVQPALPAPEIYHYRNKMEFSFSNHRWLTTDEIKSEKRLRKDFALGLHVTNSYDKVLNVENCFLLSERSNRIVRLVYDFAMKSGLLPYTTTDHSGFWRFLVIRESKRLDQIMVNLVTADYPDGNLTIRNLANLMTQEFPFIKTVVHNINRKKAQIAFGDEEQIIFGPGYIEEKLGAITYRISANSFFQTNSSQAEAMYQLIVDWGKFRKDQIVYDFYSGSGGIALFIADQVQKVIGFELVPQAIQDANVNCQINEIQNCHFIEGDLKQSLTNPDDLMQRYGRPSVVIIDPPRSGLHPKLPERILQLNPDKMIYVSCNPASLARDLAWLCTDTFKPALIQPIDMFPHTAHCETVVLLER